MKERIYRLLLENEGRFLSGQEISAQLGVTRAAVWKAIDALRRDGYTVEARTGLGYRLLGMPDALTEREIRRYLPADGLVELRCFGEIDSTNSYLKREALSGAPLKPPP